MKGQAGYPLQAAGLSLSGSLCRTHNSEDLGGGARELGNSSTYSQQSLVEGCSHRGIHSLGLSQLQRKS